MSVGNEVCCRMVYCPLLPLISVAYHTAIGCLGRFLVSRLKKYDSNEATFDAQCPSEDYQRPWVYSEIQTCG